MHPKPPLDHRLSPGQIHQNKMIRNQSHDQIYNQHHKTGKDQIAPHKHNNPPENTRSDLIAKLRGTNRNCTARHKSKDGMQKIINHHKTNKGKTKILEMVWITRGATTVFIEIWICNGRT